MTLFADGAGAVVLKSEQGMDRGYLASQLISQGQYNEYMGIYAGGAKQPVTEDVLDRHDHQLKFVTKFDPDLNPTMWSQMARNLSERIGHAPSEVEPVFHHSDQHQQHLGNDGSPGRRSQQGAYRDASLRLYWLGLYPHVLQRCLGKRTCERKAIWCILSARAAAWLRQRAFPD